MVSTVVTVIAMNKVGSTQQNHNGAFYACYSIFEETYRPGNRGAIWLLQPQYKVMKNHYDHREDAMSQIINL